MNPELPSHSREELELRVTALLLGELNDAEATAVRDAIAQDPELQKLHDDLKETIQLVREATVTMGDPETAQAERLQLAEGRRKALHVAFTIPPLKPEHIKRKRRFEIRLIEVLAVVAIIAILAAMMLPALSKAKHKAKSITVLNNMRQLELAKQMWADDKAQPKDATPTLEDLKPYLGNRAEMPPVSGERYVLGKVGQPVIAEVDAKNARQSFGRLPAKPVGSGSDGDVVQISSDGKTTWGMSTSTRGFYDDNYTTRERALNQKAPAQSAPGGLAIGGYVNAKQPASTTSSRSTVRPTDILLPKTSELETVNGSSDTFAFGVGRLTEGNSSVDAVVPSGLKPTEVEPIKLTFANAANVAAAIDSLQDGRDNTRVDSVNNTITLSAGDQEGAELLAKLDTQSKQQLIGEVDENGSTPRGGQAGGGFGGGGPLGMNDTWGSYDGVTPGQTGAVEWFERANGREFTKSEPATGGRPVDMSSEQSLRRQSDEEAKFGNTTDDLALGDKPPGPALGDRPMLGRIFRSEIAATPAKPTQTFEAEPTPDTSGFGTLNVSGGTLYAEGTVVNGGALGLEGKAANSFDVVYDDPGSFIPQAQLGGGGVPITGNAPKPRYRTQSDSTPRPSGLNETLKSEGDSTTAYYSSLVKEQQHGDAVLARENAPKGNLLRVEEAWITPGDRKKLPKPDVNGQPRFAEVGDPEWSGLLERPEPSRSVTNHFLGRYAYTVVPESGSGGEKVQSNVVLPTTGFPAQPEASDQLLTGGLRDSSEWEMNLGAYLVDLDEKAKRDEPLERQLAQSELKRQNESLKINDPEASDTGSAAGNVYFAKKRDLETLLAFQKTIENRLAMEAVDLSLPRTGTVAIMDRAVPETDASLLGNLGHAFGKDYQASARIRLERPAADIKEFGESRTSGTYDPYFVQSEFEAMKSEAVLTNVIANLNLTQKWGELTTEQAVQKLRRSLELKPVPNTMFTEIKARSSDPQEAAEIANAVAESYRAKRRSEIQSASEAGIKALKQQFDEQQKKISTVNRELAELRTKLNISDAAASGVVPQVELDTPLPRKPATNAPVPQPEILTSENNFSTFSLNVSDVSFKLAAASLEKGQMPEAASIRSEEFINAFDYRDPEPTVPLPGGDRGGFSPIAFAWERARYPFAHNRDQLRFSLKTSALGRQAGRPLNIVLLLDNSGSMERADRVKTVSEALRVLASQLQPQDKLSVITFARIPRLIVDGTPGDKAGAVAEAVSGLTPQGGTNLEEAMNLAYQTALRHYLANGINRVVVLTDGAANLGEVEPELLKQQVEANRKQGIALDCFGIGWEGFNDDLLEVLSRNGDGRYGFINSPEEAATDFAGQLAGALKVAASDVKVQVEFNSQRVTSYRQIGYAKHQLTKEQFRDNTVDAAEIAAQEAGNALYTVAVNPAGVGPLATVRVRYKVPGTTDYREQSWDVPYTGNAVALDQASPAMRLAATASAFSEWLVVSPYAGEVTPDALLGYLSGVPEMFGADPRPKKLEWMIRQVKSIGGK